MSPMEAMQTTVVACVYPWTLAKRTKRFMDPRPVQTCTYVDAWRGVQVSSGNRTLVPSNNETLVSSDGTPVAGGTGGRAFAASGTPRKRMDESKFINWQHKANLPDEAVGQERH